MGQNYERDAGREVSLPSDTLKIRRISSEGGVEGRLSGDVHVHVFLVYVKSRAHLSATQYLRCSAGRE